MIAKVLVFTLLSSCVLMFAGCATGGRKQDLQMQGLRNQISVLESQVQNKDEEIASLREALTRSAEEKEARIKTSSKKRARVIGEIKSRPSIKQIQIALRNAGYNPGPADGRTGRQTKDAIRAFQSASGLAADGKVGKQTWSLLKEYLYKKIK